LAHTSRTLDEVETHHHQNNIAFALECI